MWTRWRCVTHDCGSYNYNNLLRHEMEACNILSEQTVGIIKPKTFGGYNGDVGRSFFEDFKKQVAEKELVKARLEQWKHFRDKKMKEYYKKRRFANRSKSILKDQGEKNQEG